MCLTAGDTQYRSNPSIIRGVIRNIIWMPRALLLMRTIIALQDLLMIRQTIPTEGVLTVCAYSPLVNFRYISRYLGS